MQRLTRNYKKCVICQVRRTPGSRVFLAQLPLDAQRCRMWVKAIGQEDLVHVPIEKLHELKFVCDLHFANEDMNGSRRRLLKHAVPTLLLPNEPLPDDMLQDFPFHIGQCPISTKEIPGSSHCMHALKEPIATQQSTQYKTTMQRLTRNYKKCVICQVRRTPGSRVFLAQLPLDAQRCRMWVKAIGQEDLVHVPIEKLHELKFVCDLHFANEDMNGSRRRLLKHAVPTLLLPNEPLPDDMLQDFPFHIGQCPISTKEIPGSSHCMHALKEPIATQQSTQYKTTCKIKQVYDSS